MSSRIKRDESQEGGGLQSKSSVRSCGLVRLLSLVWSDADVLRQDLGTARDRIGKDSGLVTNGSFRQFIDIAKLSADYRSVRGTATSALK
jgi:hypothetical protein